MVLFFGDNDKICKQKARGAVASRFISMLWRQRWSSRALAKTPLLVIGNCSESFLQRRSSRSLAKVPSRALAKTPYVNSRLFLVGVAVGVFHLPIQLVAAHVLEGFFGGKAEVFFGEASVGVASVDIAGAAGRD